MRFPFVFLTTTCLLFLAACGGGSHTALAPQFTSTPNLSATQDVLYVYNITAADPSGGSVSFALSSGPSGASISGSTLSWTPTAAQSRMANTFTITAMTSEGISATQSWTLTPSGTINGSKIDTYWSASGSSNVPFDWTSANLTIAALAPQTDGSFQTLSGSGNSDGTFSIPKVPGGHYWLQIGATAYWTNSSIFDQGSDIAGHQSRYSAICVFCQPTNFDFNISGLDAMPLGEQLEFLTDLAFPFNVSVLGPANSTTFVATEPALGFVPDFSDAKSAFFMQFEPQSVGSIRGVGLGPELTFSNLSLSNNTDNSISGNLAASPQSSFDLSVKGSLWAPLFNNIGPNAATPVSAYLNVIAHPFLPAGDVQLGVGSSVNSPLFLTLVTPPFGGITGLRAPGPCQPVPGLTEGFDIVVYAAPVLTDQDFGTLLYGDPYPSAWPRFFSLCQTATMPVPIPGSNSSATFVFDAGVNTALPTSSVAPLISQVQNPTIQGVNLYSASTITTKFPTVNWTAPATGSASGYRIGAHVLTTQPNGNQGYAPWATYYTLQPSVALPTLLPNNTYVFVLTALADSLANVESSPNRSGLPNGFASVVSAPITISAGAQ